MSSPTERIGSPSARPLSKNHPHDDFIELAKLDELERHLVVLKDRAEQEGCPLIRASWEDQAAAVQQLIDGVRARLFS